MLSISIIHTLCRRLAIVRSRFVCVYDSSHIVCCRCGALIHASLCALSADTNAVSPVYSIAIDSSFRAVPIIQYDYGISNAAHVYAYSKDMKNLCVVFVLIRNVSSPAHTMGSFVFFVKFTTMTL